MRWVLALLLCGVLVACMGDDESSPDETAVREATETLLAQVEDGHYDAAWESMHPAYQAVIPREQLVDCGSRFPAVFIAYEIGDVEQGEYDADEIGTIDAWRVEVTFEANDAFKAQSQTEGMIDRSFNFTRDGDQWRWFPGTGELGVFRDGNCGLPWPGGSS